MFPDVCVFDEAQIGIADAIRPKGVTAHITDAHTSGQSCVQRCPPAAINSCIDIRDVSRVVT